MADFVQTTNVKSAVRKLASLIADVAAFNLIVQSVMTDNPFACVAYMTAGHLTWLQLTKIPGVFIKKFIQKYLEILNNDTQLIICTS